VDGAGDIGREDAACVAAAIVGKIAGPPLMPIDPSSSSQFATREEGGATTLPMRRSEINGEARPARIGGFVVLRKLGEGGMGVVYAAYDEELERKVAIKLLRTDFSGEQQSLGQARLLREAQAMAKLSHPNVAQIYAVGEASGAVFIAMEFVSGGNLREWLERANRGWRAVLAAYLQAGQGLAAAHAAGIVHRDFKPDNVLMGEDQRVRVVDFGLARPGEATAELTMSSVSGSATSGSFPGIELTQQGAFIGTPAYMAPEQHRREPADAQSDQFSFCIALYEGLYGRRPFRGADAVELARNVINGQRQDPPRDSPVPGWVHAVLVRGLSREPAQRFPDMTALLAALSADPDAARRRRWSIAGIVLASGLAAAGGGYAMVELRESEAAVCTGARERLAGVWDEAVAERVRASLTATEVSYADDVAARVQERLGAYADAWVAAHGDACEVHQRGEQSDALYDLRMTCLGERRTALAALVAVLTAADAAVVERAVQAADRLPLLARCSEGRALLSQSPPPEDPAVAAAVGALEARLARPRAMYEVGQYAPARTEVVEVRGELEALGHAPTLAAALHLEGLLADSLGEYPASEALLLRAVATADAGRDDDLRALALGDLARAIGLRQARFAEGLRHAELARGVVQRLADGRPAAAALAIRFAEIELQQGDFTAAEPDIARAIELQSKLHGEDSTVFAVAVDAAANLQFLRGRYAEALAEYRRVEAIYRAAYGPNHPLLGKVLNNIGATQFSLFDYAAAEATHTRVLEILRNAHGPKHPSLGTVYSNLGLLALAQAQFPRAIEEFRRSLAIYEGALPADHPSIGDCWTDLGHGYLVAGDYEAAEQAFTRAQAVYLRAFGPGHPRSTQALASVGQAQLRRGRIAEAEQSLQQAIREFHGPPEDPILASAEAVLGKLRVVQGRLPEASTLLERALAGMEKQPGGVEIEIAGAQFALAGVRLRLAPAEAARCRNLAEAARASFLRFGAQFQGEVAQIDRWLAQSPAPAGG
jgi:tetratricopeptide (TPR) repeat protein/predicted Ser/Thr protein kinase